MALPVGRLAAASEGVRTAAVKALEGRSWAGDASGVGGRRKAVDDERRQFALIGADRGACSTVARESGLWTRSPRPPITALLSLLELQQISANLLKDYMCSTCSTCS